MGIILLVCRLESHINQQSSSQCADGYFILFNNQYSQALIVTSFEWLYFSLQCKYIPDQLSMNVLFKRCTPE